MSAYNINNLTPHDFENLARDVSQTVLGLRVEAFTTGKDGGIDFRHGDDKQGVIIQAKHISEYKNLKSQLKKEVVKIEKLNPQRYILICSTPLTPNNKKEIRKLFGDSISKNDDIIGRADLDNILENNPKLAKQHYKLWFSSLAILQSILHNAPIERSKAKYEDILKKLKYYVSTKNLNEAIEILDKKNFLIISGIPGIGKTTLADLLTLSYVDTDYEFIYIQSIEEAESFFDSNKKQFFYFDDFLGRNNLVEGKEIGESKLSFFLKRVSESRSKKLVMTTREYILRQAKQVTDTLSRKEVEYSTCILELEDYTRYQKAQILYNHLYHSKISKGEIGSILKENNYLKIIDHPNYNPRLIELITQTDEFSSGSRRSFFTRFQEILDNPQEIWKRAFENAKPASQYLLYSLLSSPDEVDIDELKRQFGLIVEYCNKNQRNFIKKDDFEKSLKELDDSFVKLSLNNKKQHIVSFKNPSVRDYLINYLEGNRDIVLALFETSLRITSLHGIFSVRKRTKTDDLFIFGTKLGKEKINIGNELIPNISALIQKRFYEFIDIPTNDQNLLIRRVVQIIDFWGSKIPIKLKSFLMEIVKTYSIENLQSKDKFENYFSSIKKLDLDTEEKITEVIKQSLKLLQEGFVELEVAKIIAFVYGEARYEVREISRDMNIDFEKEVKNIVAGEADSFNYGHDEAHLREVLEGIEEIESVFGHDYSYEKRLIERAIYDDTDFDDDSGPSGRNSGKDDDSNLAIKSLFSSL